MLRTSTHNPTPPKSSLPNALLTLSDAASPPPSTVKIKTFLHNLILSRISRFLRALKSAVARAFQEIEFLHYFADLELLKIKSKREKNSMSYRKKILLGSFRLHYNWCSSSHVLPINYTTPVIDPISSPPLEGKGTGEQSFSSTSEIYCDSTWNSAFSTDYSSCNESFDGRVGSKRSGLLGADDIGNCGGSNEELSSYLEWLEEKGQNREDQLAGGEEMMNQIDQLADLFIANCHEKFRLEKIESYRRYQEMLARSM